jgi:hypothetical protein
MVHFSQTKNHEGHGSSVHKGKSTVVY